MKPADETAVGTQAFRDKCIETIANEGYFDRENFFQRFRDGENFDSAKLRNMGYNQFAARNLSAYINNSHEEDYYAHSLYWE
jgi:imidazoleglycerol phosphate synthase glutamine amidotransferase subunit HisH